jgi:hypothetical protein
MRPRSSEKGPHAFELWDAMGGFTQLVKRSPTLDGAVPLRVAQACAPLLEGNAFGFQIVLAKPIRVRRRLSGLVVEVDEAVARAHRAAIPALVARGDLPAGGAWHRALLHAPAWVERGRVRLWTGLLVRASAPGTCLRVSNPANRRNFFVDVRECYVVERERWVPLVLDLAVTHPLREVAISGEVACLAPLSTEATVELARLEDAPWTGRAHAKFYDEPYFSRKKGGPTRKYRHLAAGERRPPSPKETSPGRASSTATARVVQVGPAKVEVLRVTGFVDPGRTTLRETSSEGSAPTYVQFHNDVAFRASFDGHTMAVEPDARALASGAKEVERTWASAYGSSSIERDRRALWYLTKYFTPHPPGEPHFFVKPWALVETQAGWCSLLEGRQTPSWDVLRGVVATDVFHATPAVFAWRTLGAWVTVPSGEPLLRVFPVPAWLLHAPYRRAPKAAWLE